MRCPKCNSGMKEVKVKIQDADSPVTSYQCAKCGYFDFEEKSINKAIDEFNTPFKSMWKTAKARGITKKDVKEQLREYRK